MQSPSLQASNCLQNNFENLKLQMLQDAITTSDRFFLQFADFLDNDIFPTKSEAKPLATSVFIPAHVGFMTVDTSSESVRRDLAKFGYQIDSIFESTVVAKKLRDRYGREDISIEIIKANHVDLIHQQVEVFVARQGLNFKQRIAEAWSTNHFALTTQLKTTQEQSELIDIFVKHGFLADGSGMNTSENVTVMYFRKDGLKIELLIQGEHPQLLEKYLLKFHEQPSKNN